MIGGFWKVSNSIFLPVTNIMTCPISRNGSKPVIPWTLTGNGIESTDIVNRGEIKQRIVGGAKEYFLCVLPGKGKRQNERRSFRPRACSATEMNTQTRGVHMEVEGVNGMSWSMGLTYFFSEKDVVGEIIIDNVPFFVRMSGICTGNQNPQAGCFVHLN